MGDDDIAALNYSNLLNRHRDLSTKFESVKFVGGPHIRPGFQRKIFAPLLECSNTQGLKSSLDLLAVSIEKLRRFDIYKDIRVSIERAKSSTTHELNLDVIIRAPEKSRIWMKTGAEVGNQEGKTYASFGLRNVFGGAESLEGNASFGTKTRTDYNARFATPINSDPELTADITMFRNSQSNPYASHEAYSQGCVAKVQRTGDDLSNGIALCLVDRLLTSHRESASLAARRCAGLSRKISILHTVHRDTRNCPVMPNSGLYLSLQSELAGAQLIGGNASFFKFTLAGSKHVAVSADESTVFHFASKLGILWSLSGTGETYLSDRFQLGGPHSVRAFKVNGLGPRQDGDSIGGDLLFANAISVSTPVPHVNGDSPLRMQAFVNFGSLISLNREKPYTSILQLIARPSVSVGLGLSYAIPGARVELSLGVPLVARANDQMKKGLSLGFGAEFL